MGRDIKVVTMRVRARVRAFFTNAGMGKGTIVPYPLSSLLANIYTHISVFE